jgi:pimeloyl-ACP methyl ester carboxylesterase/DNA-binding CsgD family transcriptional regulator
MLARRPLRVSDGRQCSRSLLAREAAVDGGLDASSLGSLQFRQARRGTILPMARPLASADLEQRIRFCSAPDGVQLAYAEHGEGPPLVKAANWLTHLEFDWDSPIWRHWLEGLGTGHRMVRYDERGCGLSDREFARDSLDAHVQDLEAVVDAAELDRFALLGISQGGALAISYAVRHPERVSHLLLCGAYARGRMRRSLTAPQREQEELLRSVMEVGWGRPDATFRRVFTMMFVPEATPEQMEWFDELERVSATPETALRLRRAWSQIDVTDRLGRISAPTLVAHARDELVVPFAEGRRLATGIHNARFLPLEGRNHILLADEPAWPAFLAEARGFLGTDIEPPTPTLDELSPREVEVLELVAAGLSNEEISARLYLSVRTVERHLSNVYAKLRISGKAARAAAAARFTSIRR